MRAIGRSLPAKALTLALALMIAVPGAFASKTAGVIAAVSAINAGKWGIIAALDLEPASKTACGVITGVYGIISGGAWLYDVIADPPPAGPPVITAIYDGPSRDRDSATGELVPPENGFVIHSAEPYRIVSIVGSNFSWVPGDMTITFGGVPAQILGMSTNTLVMAYVPRLDDPLPQTANVVVSLAGQSSGAYAFQVEFDSDENPPTGLAEAILAKETKLMQLVKNANWDALLTQEAPNLTPQERASALAGAAQMHQGAIDVLANIPTAAQGLVEPQVREGTEKIIIRNPELESYIDESIADLRARGVRPDRHVVQAPAPVPHP
jgi:hypothetical protein